MRFHWRAAAAALAACTALGVAGCGGQGGGGGGGGQPAKTVTIAYQPGIGYAPLLIMQQEGWLKNALPGKTFVFRQLDSGAAIRDGMISGDIQVGSGGLGPFLVGWAKGIDWKVLTPMEDMNLWLMAKKPQYRTLQDFKDGGKIAMPAPDSIQAVVLRKGAKEKLGNANALDSNIVALGHPEGLQALLSGQIAGHLTSPPFEFQEQERGAHKVIDSYSLFGGPHTFNSIFMRQGFYEANRDVADALSKNVQRAVTMLREQPAQAAQILAKQSGGKVSAKQFQEWITHDGVQYTTQPHGFVKIAQFMKEIGLIDKAPASVDEVTFPNVQGGGAS
jgi:NitT/TauT family transport system substrate-binding protein